MKQISFAQAEHQNKKKVTRCERFLAQMEVLVPWQAPVSCDQEPLRLPEGALPGAGQEPGAAIQPVRAGQSGAGGTMRRTR